MTKNLIAYLEGFLILPKAVDVVESKASPASESIYIYIYQYKEIYKLQRLSFALLLSAYMMF